ncbi:AcrR family transcriptional regulator [Actinoplanes lutulentus]|uniref:TetR family transcriptional regulator n=1 Tax=Actinoplanes lutulentus TaxID=1287878 RepID=A0A327ZBC2_9ACTN|nr:TetR/AcrR family transcriptional regulator [Actinoplanes lutulentus]MBB2947326.1 AcrR family transcriptional regulator [Actinoplanes lutulentus]RAK36601.1 TetR family transcriptional regulator [Actinoplanes lutulentus]
MGVPMAPETRLRPHGAGKQQLHATALRLFAHTGVAGTTMQAIADEMGVTKAALFYHYKSKDDLVLGVVAPIFEKLAAVLTKAEFRRGRQAQLNEILTGCVDLVLEFRSQYAVLMNDPYVSRLLARHEERPGWESRVGSFIVRVASDPADRIPLMVFIGGLASPLGDPAVAALDDAVLREQFLDSGRRLLQIRRRSAGESTTA